MSAAAGKAPEFEYLMTTQVYRVRLACGPVCVVRTLRDDGVTLLTVEADAGGEGPVYGAIELRGREVLRYEPCPGVSPSVASLVLVQAAAAWCVSPHSRPRRAIPAPPDPRQMTLDDLACATAPPDATPADDGQTYGGST